MCVHLLLYSWLTETYIQYLELTEPQNRRQYFTYCLYIGLIFELKIVSNTLVVMVNIYKTGKFVTHCSERVTSKSSKQDALLDYCQNRSDVNSGVGSVAVVAAMAATLFRSRKPKHAYQNYMERVRVLE